MTKGPFGFPRVTDIGPFAEKEADQLLEIVVENRRFPPEQGVSERLIEDGVVTETGWKRVTFKFIVREELESDSTGTIIDKIKHEIDSLTRDKTIGRGTYSYNGDVAIVGNIKVEGDFRRMGIGTTLKNKMLDDMRDRGIGEVYTVIASSMGRSLAERTGFTEESPILADDEVVMYRTL